MKAISWHKAFSRPLHNHNLKGVNCWTSQRGDIYIDMTAGHHVPSAQNCPVPCCSGALSGHRPDRSAWHSPLSKPLAWIYANHHSSPQKPTFISGECLFTGEKEQIPAASQPIGLLLFFLGSDLSVTGEPACQKPHTSLVTQGLWSTTVSSPHLYFLKRHFLLLLGWVQLFTGSTLPCMRKQRILLLL